MNNVLEKLQKRNDVNNYVSPHQFFRAANYDIEEVSYDEDGFVKNPKTGDKSFEFTIDKGYYSYVDITINRLGAIKDAYCTCREFMYYDRCEHIGAVCIHYYDMLFKKDENDILELSKYLLDQFKIEKNNVIKKEVKVELNLNITANEYYHNYSVNVKLLLGENKLYTLGNHFNEFKRAYQDNEGEVYFGKNFTYNSHIHYFTKESKDLIDAYFKVFLNGSNSYNVNLNSLFYLLKDSQFTINNYKIDGIIEGFPLNTNLVKSENGYDLIFDTENIINFSYYDYEYILYKGKMYHLNKREQELLKQILDTDIEKIVIPKNKKEQFTKGLLNIIRNGIEIDASVDDLTLPKKINGELYFDLRNNYIIATPKFKYDDIEVQYFDKKSLVLRDMDYETNVINDILKYGFIIENDKLVLKDLESQVEFIESGLEELAKDYPVFTTEKFKNVNIRKKSNVSSMFGIGEDKILSYNFDLGDIKSDELVNIFKEIKNKKKYYRLKSGDILNLEDNSLKQLESLSEDLELSDEDIINGRGSVQKYRAIYLDSLKDSKYNIISTDNLFDNFIKNFYEYKDCNLTLKKKELSVLRDYQLVGVKWLYNLAKTGFGGILADEMGLGKTIQVIYYIKQILMEKSDARFLIVVPTSLAYNWEHEFDVFAPSVKKEIVVGSKISREQILSDLKDVEVLITTYGILREDSDLYSDKMFHTMIIDEAQTIKNNLAGVTKCVKKINSEVKFALTGTPLENSILELWSIFDFIMPGYLANLSKFQSKYKIKDFNEDSEVLIKNLSRQINPFILRRKKSDVVKELPEKLINDIYIDLDSEQKKLYVAELERVKKKMEELTYEEGFNKAKFLILQLLTRLRQFCIDPNIVYENYTGKSSKIEAIGNIVNEYIENGHKILIFSSFLTGLNVVKKELEKNKINCFMIDGSVKAKKRIDYVNDFNNKDEVKVFLIMLKSGGTGLNLIGADVVIHLDLWWNPQAENQATDRAHRIGQTKNVEVIHLITKGTIEEKILEMQNKKRMLSDKLIDGEARDKNLIAELTEKDIKNLLSYENKD